MVTNKPGFIPKKSPIQPECYTEFFNKINAVFLHPTKNVTLYIQVNADTWKYNDPRDAKGPLEIIYQAEDCRHPVGPSYSTCNAAISAMSKILQNEHFGEKFQNPPILRKNLPVIFPNINVINNWPKFRRKAMKKKYVLTEEDKTILKDFGENEKYYPQIERAINQSTYVIDKVLPNKNLPNYAFSESGYTNIVHSINAQEAIEYLGKETFLSGIRRSAFHYTSTRETPDGKYLIHFDSSIIFKQ